MALAGLKLQRAVFISVMALLLTSDPAISDGTKSCTDDCAPFIPGAVGYWQMTLASKGSDMSGNGNNATFVGLTYTDGPNGEPNSAVHFHGNENSYAWITKSPSLEVGKYPGFSFCGFVRLSGGSDVPLIDWRSVQYGLNICVSYTRTIWLNLYTSNSAIKQIVNISNLTFTAGSWRFFGVSYDKATGRVTGFMDGMKEQKQLDKNIVAETATTSKVGLGIRLIDMGDPFNGDMSCLMLFKVALTADDFERVWRFCRTIKSTPTALLNITVSDIAATTATASWTKSPGTFSGYNITIERNGSGPGQETCDPQSIPSSALFPRVILANLIPGATYRVRVWHMQADIKGGARSSAWFNTMPFPVKPESIIFSAITATSAEVTWDEATGTPDGYSVEIRPTTGGAKVDPSTVPRGTTTTSLKNLSPGSYYTIIIRSKIRSTLSSPSMKSLQTPAATDPPKPDTPKPEPPIAVIGLAVAVICLVVMIALIAVIVILFRRISSLSTRSGDAKNLPMSNLGFQQDDPSTSKTKNEDEYDGYEVPDRSKYGGNSGSRQIPHQSAEDSNETTADNVYENLNN